MKILWRKSAIVSLIELDQWRETLDLPPIATFIKKSVDNYFEKQDFSFYTPGKQVFLQSVPVDLRMTFLSIGKSAPYKVFYKITSINIEIILIRHPAQKPLE